jgi:hypothetical protein
MDSFRAPFFWLAVLALILAVLVEFGSVGALHSNAAASLDVSTPGWGIRYLPILDLMLLYGIVTIGLGELLPRAVVGRAQGIIALVLSFFGCIGAIILAILALTMLMLMITLLVAVPFGTIAYLAAWGTFPSGTAQSTLALIMFLKLAMLVLLILAQQRFLKNKGLMILSGVSLGATWLVSFLVAFPPSFLAAITDMIGALVIAIVGIIWLVLLFIGSLLSIVSVIRSIRT